MPDMKLFAGNATPELAQRIANRLYTSLGDAAVGRFSDGEVSVQINENVRGGDIFHHPVHLCPNQRQPDGIGRYG